MNKKMLASFICVVAVAQMAYCADCGSCGSIKPNTFSLINSGYTHGAPVEAVAFLCYAGEYRDPLIAVGGHTATCSGEDYPVSLRICTMNPNTGAVDQANCVALHPTEHVYGVAWCYVPPSGLDPEQILLAVVGSANELNENVWIYNVSNGVPANATLVATFNHGESDLLSVSWLCEDCIVSGSSTRTRLLAVGGELGNGPNGTTMANIRVLQLTLPPSLYSLNETDYKILGSKVYQVAISPCVINGCYYVAAGALADATSCPSNFQIYVLTCGGGLMETVDPVLVGGNTTKVRTVAWCCIDSRRPLIAITIDPALQSDWDSFPAGSNLQIFFYNSKMATLMPIAYKSIDGTLLSSAWNPCPECNCKQITVGSGCTEYCIENIYELSIDCSKAPHYPNELLEIAKRNFDDQITSLAWCCRPGTSNCSYLLAGSESKSYNPYGELIDPICSSDEDPCSNKDYAIFKASFCQKLPYIPVPVCERLTKKEIPLKRLK